MKELYYFGVFLSIVSAIVGIITFFINHNNSNTDYKKRLFLFGFIFIVSTAITAATYLKEKHNGSLGSSNDELPEFNQPGHYIANGSEARRIYFYNTPNAMTRRSAYINSQVEVFVIQVQNNFGYIEFTNSRGESSYGWIEMRYLISKPN